MTISPVHERLGGPAMFDRIAQRYDLMNRLLSLGLDRRWRAKLVSSVGPLAAGDRVLDLATGTADVALALAAAWPDADVLGLDPSEGMLAIGAEKIRKEGLDQRITLASGDAQQLPFADGHVAAVTMAFGIRNVPDRALALAEMMRVTRPGGLMGILELSLPTGSPWAPLARLHVRHIVPQLGRWIAGSAAYDYLASSMEAFPEPERFRQEVEAAGFVHVQSRTMAGGTAHLVSARVPG